VVNAIDVKDDDLRFRLSRCDTQIRIEFDLIGYRMTWLMTSQAFLFAAFTVCVTAPQPRLILLAHWLQFVLPTVGVISALVVAIAIGAPQVPAAQAAMPGRKGARLRLGGRGDADLPGGDPLLQAGEQLGERPWPSHVSPPRRPGSRRASQAPARARVLPSTGT
jgi:hypothetical protein